MKKKDNDKIKKIGPNVERLWLDPCENWVSTPGPKRNTLESRGKIKLSIMYAYCLQTHLNNQKCRFRSYSTDFEELQISFSEYSLLTSVGEERANMSAVVYL